MSDIQGDILRKLSEKELSVFLDYPVSWGSVHEPMIGALKQMHDEIEGFIILQPNFIKGDLTEFEGEAFRYTPDLCVVVNDYDWLHEHVLERMLSCAKTELVMVATIEHGLSWPPPDKVDTIMLARPLPGRDDGVMFLSRPGYITAEELRVILGSFFLTSWIVCSYQYALDPNDMQKFLYDNLQICCVNVYDDSTFVIIQRKGLDVFKEGEVFIEPQG